MKINLDACPFCGGKAKITAYTTDNDELKFYAYCESCGVVSPNFDTIPKCENWWNTRVYPESDAKLIQQRYCKHEPCNHCEGEECLPFDADEDDGRPF